MTSERAKPICPHDLDAQPADYSSLVGADTAALLDEALGAGKWGDHQRRWAGGMIFEHGRERFQAALTEAIKNGAARPTLFVAAALTKVASVENPKQETVNE